MILYFLIVSGFAAIVYFGIKSTDKAEVSVLQLTKEKVKKILLQVTQLIAVLTTFGFLAEVPFLGTLGEALEYIGVNIDSVWDGVLGLINIAIGFWSLFKTNPVPVVDSVNEAGAKTVSVKHI